MLLMIIGVALALMKYFEWGPVAAWSWWWVLSPLLLAFVWFEVFERLLGFDKKRAHDAMDKVRARRVKETFKQIQKKRK